MSRIFLSLHPFYEGGPIMGRKLANRGFMDAMFRKDPFDMYHFFVDNPKSLMDLWEETPDAAPLLKRGALHAFPRTHLEKRLKVVPYTVCHFSDPMTEFAAMCRVRNAFAPRIFPITAVNHTISYVEYAESTLGHVWQGCTARDGIGCTSSASRNIMESWYNHARNAYNIPDAWSQPQLKVIPLGVPDPNLGGHKDMRTQFRNEFNIAPETVFILLYGRISIVDKMDVRPLFAALRRLCAKHPNLPLVFFVAGSMDDDNSVTEQMLKLAKYWNIPFNIIPNPSRKRKKELFAAADIFVSPVDNIQETFGLTLVEAAQSSLPVIASNWDGYKDIVLHGETGFLIPTLTPTDTPILDSMAGVFFNKIHQLFRSQQTAMHVPYLEEALLKLIFDADLRKKMGETAKKRAAELYTFDTVIDRWMDFWNELENTPISAEQQAFLQSAKHPYSLDFGKTFAVYASHHLQNDTHIKCTDLGYAFLHKKYPWNNYGLAAVNLVESLMYKLVETIGDGCNVQELLDLVKSSMWGKKFPQEVLFTHIYWLLKHDLIECTLPETQ